MARPETIQVVFSAPLIGMGSEEVVALIRFLSERTD